VRVSGEAATTAGTRSLERVNAPARTRRSRATAAVSFALAAALVLGACGGSGHSGSPTPSTLAGSAAAGGADGFTAAQLAEAKRLLDPDNEPRPPTKAQVECVARVVVLNPTVDEIANDMAQLDNPDLRQLVMGDYLTCAYDFVLDLYMRFAPHDLTVPQKSCIRGKFTQLSVQRLAEVMVLDPDAGYTGPLVIHLCKTGSTANPLLHGTLPSMGSS